VAHTVEAPPLASPLEDKVAYVHYLMRMRAIGQEVARHNGVVGRRVKLALKPMIRDAFPMPEAQLEHLSSDIRQVLKKIGAAVCISHGAHETPVWFVADEIGKDYVAVSRWVATRSAGTREGLKPTRAELRVTPTEAGEDRQPAPVEVRQAPETTTKDTPMAPQTPEFLAKIAKDYQTTQREAFIDLVKQAFKELESDVLSGYEIAEYLAPVTGSQVGSIRGRVRELEKMGVLYKRLETNDEQRARFPGRETGSFGGAPAALYALSKEALKQRHVAQHAATYPRNGRPALAADEPAIDLTEATPIHDAAALGDAVIKLVGEFVGGSRVAELEAQVAKLTEERNELRAWKRRVQKATGIA
jgi:hypothetical protein